MKRYVEESTQKWKWENPIHDHFYVYEPNIVKVPGWWHCWTLTTPIETLWKTSRMLGAGFLIYRFWGRVYNVYLIASILDRLPHCAFYFHAVYFLRLGGQSTNAVTFITSLSIVDTHSHFALSSDTLLYRPLSFLRVAHWFRLQRIDVFLFLSGKSDLHTWHFKCVYI